MSRRRLRPEYGDALAALRAVARRKNDAAAVAVCDDALAGDRRAQLLFGAAMGQALRILAAGAQ